MAKLFLLFLLALGVGGAPGGPEASGEEAAGAGTSRGARCIGMLGSARGSVQGIVAENKTPAERLQEFRTRVEAVRALVVPPGLRRPQSPPTIMIGSSQPSGGGIPLAGQPSYAGTGLSILGQPAHSGVQVTVPSQPQPPSSGAGHTILGQPPSPGAGHSILGQPPSPGAGLQILTPIQRTIADVRSALTAAGGAQTSLPVSPFTDRQVAAALSIPQGIIKNTAEMLGATRDQADSILGSPHNTDTEVAADDHRKPPTLTDILNTAIGPVESIRDENPQTVRPDLLHYVPRIPTP